MVKSIEGCQVKMFRCRVEGYIDCPNLKDRIEDFTTVTLDITPNLTKEDIQRIVKNKAKENILFRVAKKNHIMPEYVFWRRKEGSRNNLNMLDVEVTILKSWAVPIEIEEEQFTQFALDL